MRERSFFALGFGSIFPTGGWDGSINKCIVSNDFLPAADTNRQQRRNDFSIFEKLFTAAAAVVDYNL